MNRNPSVPMPIAAARGTETSRIFPPQLRFKITPSKYKYGNSPSIARLRQAFDVSIDFDSHRSFAPSLASACGALGFSVPHP